jgi:Domain of unknown function (DUF5666)
MKALKQVSYWVLLALMSAVAGCGGGGNSNVATGIGGTGKIASGSITRFGSIFVNGIEYDIDMASCSVDDSDVTGNCQANLALGMVVTVQGTVSGATGTANSVVFDAYAEGPVTALTTQPDGLTRHFFVLGTEVVVDTAVTRFDNSAGGFGFDSLSEGNVVRISGFIDPAGVLQATYIGRIADSAAFGTTAVKLKGSAANVTGSGVAGGSFTINGVTVSIVAGTELGNLPGARVSNGDSVTVSGILSAATSVDASKIEPEDTRIGEDGNEVSVEGLVSGFSGDLGSFLVDGHSVDASEAELQPAGLQLRNGLKVEVEGVISGTTLVARDIEGRGGEIKIDARVSARTTNTLTMTLGFAAGTLASGSLTVNVDSQTRIEDSTDVVENPLLSDINPGDFVQVRGFQDNSGITATEIHRESPDKVLLQGPVDSFSAGSSITILGITFFTDGGTEFDDSNDNSLDSATFYAALGTGDIVKIEDDSPGDGTAEEVDQEN